VVDPLVVALPLSILTAIIVSLLTKPPADAHIQRCFMRSREKA
jgi:SSS family solute:Na+ symporter